MLTHAPVVSNFATYCASVVTPATTARNALALMSRAGVRCLPVRHAGEIVGVVKKSRVEAAVARLGTDVSVRDLMILHPSVVAPETSLYEVLDEIPNSAGGCAVLQSPNGTVTGIFTGDDAMRAFHSLTLEA